MALTCYVLNDNVLQLGGLQNDVTDAYLNAATVTVTLEDTAGTEVTGETWPLSMGYVSGSDGIYRATLTDSLSLTRDKRYIAKITADGGDGLKGYWEAQVLARMRSD